MVFEDFNILNFIKILLKFSIVFKFFEYFCSSIITGKRSFSSLADGLLDITPEIKNSFERLHCEIYKLFFNFAILQIFQVPVFYLIYLLRRLVN